MRRSCRSRLVIVAAAASADHFSADVTPQSQSGEIQLQLADALRARALPGFARRLPARAGAVGPGDERAARAGLVRSALRVAEFDLGPRRGRQLVKPAPPPEAIVAVRRCAVGVGPVRGGGRAVSRRAGRSPPDLARGHHGMARSLAARGKLTRRWTRRRRRCGSRRATSSCTTRSAPSTSGCTSYEEAAAAYSNYVNLLPNKDHSDKADWSRSEIKFLRSFGQRVPFEMDPGTDDSSTPSTSGW